MTKAKIQDMLREQVRTLDTMASRNERLKNEHMDDRELASYFDGKAEAYRTIAFTFQNIVENL